MGARGRLHSARVRLARLEKLHSAGSSDLRGLERAREKARRLRLCVKAEKRAVTQAEEALRKLSTDAEWMDRGLRSEIRKAQGAVKEAARDLRAARSMERLSSQQLEGAKHTYRSAAA